MFLSEQAGKLPKAAHIKFKAIAIKCTITPLYRRSKYAA